MTGKVTETICMWEKQFQVNIPPLISCDSPPPRMASTNEIKPISQVNDNWFFECAPLFNYFYVAVKSIYFYISLRGEFHVIKKLSQKFVYLNAYTDHRSIANAVDVIGTLHKNKHSVEFHFTHYNKFFLRLVVPCFRFEQRKSN